jgi:hypothetical protein
MSKIFIFISALFLTTVTFAQQWILVAKDKQNNSIFINNKYVSKGTSDNRDGIIKIWGKDNFKSKTISHKVYQNGEMKILWEIDCKTHEYRELMDIYYNARGEEIFDDTDNTWHDVVPESVSEFVSNKVCELFNK